MLYFLPLVLAGGCVGIALGMLIGRQNISLNQSLSPRTGYGILATILFIFGAMVAFNALKLDRSLSFIHLAQLYFFEYAYDGQIALASLASGLLSALTFKYWRLYGDRYLLLGLTAFVLALLLATIIYYQPILPRLTVSQVDADGIVLQTTEATCAPAAIATLARYTGKHPQLTEREAAQIAMTTRGGTSTLAELRVLEQLGMRPQYEWNLTVQDLVARNQPALLHVLEPIDSTHVLHAIALLAIKPEIKEVVVANPLYGKSRLQFAALKDYWFGEAIFVERIPSPTRR